MISYEKISGYNENKKGVKCMIVIIIILKINSIINHNDCHDFLMTVIDLRDFFVLNIKDNDYRVYISILVKKKL